MVVGAGLAGLSAARDLRQGWATRWWCSRRASAWAGAPGRRPCAVCAVDFGGQWIGPQQKRIAALAKAVGVKTFPTYNTGLNVYDRLGSAEDLHAARSPPAEPAAIGDIAVALNSAQPDGRAGAARRALEGAARAASGTGRRSRPGSSRT